MGKKTGKRSKKKGNKGNRQGQGTSRTMNGQTYTPPMASDTDASETEEEPNPSRRTSGTRRSKKEVERKPSPVLAPLPRLTNEEYELFDKVKSGDVLGVEAALGNMDINKANRDGYTVLHIAVHRQDEAMVDLLLNQPGIKLYDTILHAIKEDNMDITKKLLAFHDKVDSEEKKELFMSYVGQVPEIRVGFGPMKPTVPMTYVQPGITSSILTDETRKGFSKPKPAQSTAIIENVERERKDRFDSEYHPVITALMLAAQVGSSPLMELFYERGERLESLEHHHNLSCTCDTCKKVEGDGDLTKAHERFQLFDSITQPLYICFLSGMEKIDPINYAISKIIKLRKMSERDLAFGERYEPFIERLETFMTDLIGLCRNTDETKVFLTPTDPEETERLPRLYPRLWYTVGLGMSKFVAHENTQNIVYKIWATDDWPEWDTYGTFNLCFQLVMRIICFPLVALILAVAQNTSLGRKLKAPVSRFLTYIGSYLCFLGIVSFQVYWPKQRCNRKDWISLGRDEPPELTDLHCKERGPPNIGTEWFIIVYVMSFYLGILKRNSVSWFWSLKSTWFELIGQLAFTATFVCWLWAYIWTKMPENQLLIDSTERLAWPHNCAEVFADCFMSLASVFAFSRVLRFAMVNPTIGRALLGIGNIMVATLGAMLIYSSVLVSFASGLLALYAPYKDFEGLDANGKPGKMDDAFSKFHTTMANLFWYLYAHTDHEPFKLLTWTHNDTSGGTLEKVDHVYTQYAGEGLYITYHVIGTMMLGSILSGYCVQKFGIDQGGIDAQWKFSRTELYLTFIKDTVLPPPFNLLFPTGGCLADGVKFCRYIGKKDDPKAACSARQCCYITGSEKERRWRNMYSNYRPLIVELIYRYRSFKGQLDAEAKATKDDIKDIKEELAELKAMFLNKKRGSGPLGGESAPSPDEDKFPPRKAWAKARRIIATGGSKYLKKKVSKGGVTTVLPAAPHRQPSRTISTEPGLLQYESTPSTPPGPSMTRTSSLPQPSSKTKLPMTTTSPQRSAHTQPSPSRTSPFGQGSAHSQRSPARTSSTPKKTPSKAPLEKKVSSKNLAGPSGRPPPPPTPPPMPKPISMTSMTTDDSEAADMKRPPR